LNIVFSERTYTHKQTDKENFSRAHHDFVVHIPAFMLFDLSKKKKEDHCRWFERERESERTKKNKNKSQKK